MGLKMGIRIRTRHCLCLQQYITL